MYSLYEGGATFVTGTGDGQVLWAPQMTPKVLPDMETPDKLLLMEFEQRNEYTRSNFTLLVSWFTFFNTVNYFAIGWFINQVVEGKLKSIVPVTFITIFFIGNNMLAVGACRALRKYFTETNDTIVKIVRDLQKSFQKESSVELPSLVPLIMYSRIIKLMMYTFLTLICFWLSILIAAIYVIRLGHTPS